VAESVVGAVDSRWRFPVKSMEADLERIMNQIGAR
jgi:hypothetical protein